MEIFEVRNNRATPTEHALLIHPFKDIYDRDTSENKIMAMLEFTYIELVCSMKKSNPYSGYSDDDKPAKVKREVFRDQEWIPDPLVREAIKVYQAFDEDASPMIRLYKSALLAAHRLGEFLQDVDLTETTLTGAAKYKPMDLQRPLAGMDAVMKNLAALKEKVQEELFDSNKTRGNRTIGAFEK